MLRYALFINEVEGERIKLEVIEYEYRAEIAEAVVTVAVLRFEVYAFDTAEKY